MCHYPHYSNSVSLVLNTQPGNVSPQFHCIYDENLNTCHRDSRFKYLWQGKAKLQTILKYEKHIVDVLPTSTSTSSGIGLPESDGPLPRFVVPWDIEDTMDKNAAAPVPNNAAQTPEPPVPVKQLLPPNVPENDPVITTRSGCRVRRSTFFGNAHSNSAFFHTFSPDQRHNYEVVCLLQNYECVIEPHPFAFAYESVMSMAVSSDPYTMTLAEAIQQPDHHEFIKAMDKELRYHIDRKHWKVILL